MTINRVAFNINKRAIVIVVKPRLSNRMLEISKWEEVYKGVVQNAILDSG